MRHDVLILGGTAEARALAGRLAAQRPDLSLILSLAGRTAEPLAQPVPVRRGGFGGADGLAAYLTQHRVRLLLDATHPFAARISGNAAEAARAAAVPLLALRRPAWRAREGDRWTETDSVAGAVHRIGSAPRRVFAALGRQELAPLEGAPQHVYLVRSVDPVEPPLAVPRVAYLLGRGPFDLESERALLLAHRIDAVLCKNSGGSASFAKVGATRELGIPVFMVRRPPLPAVDAVETVAEALLWVDHLLAAPAKRGE